MTWRGGTLGRRLTGRDTVLVDVWDILASGGRVLLEGPAGMGKTSVLRTLAAYAAEQGWVVLPAAPTEAELELPYAALADVLEPVLDLAGTLPQPQREALGSVRATAAPVTAAAEGTVAAATRSLLDAAVVKHPEGVLVVVDDLPWLDQPSRRALEFALRRTPVSALVGRRTPVASPDVPFSLDHPVVGDPIVPVLLEPLGPGAIEEILDARPGVRLSRDLVRRIARECSGNPLLAVQLDQAVRRLPRLPLPTDELPAIGGDVLETASHVLARLDPPSEAAVRTAALLSVPRLDDLRAAGIGRQDLAPAERAGLVWVTADEVEFLHPTYATAARSGLGAEERRGIHARLADAVADPDERARQLAQATAAPDADVAQELTAAAHRVRNRGAPGIAAGLFLRAAELTPPEHPEDRWQRLLAAAHCRFDMGDTAEVGALLQPVVAEAVGETRAMALLLAAQVAQFSDEPADARALAVEALTHVPEHSPQAGRIQTYVAYFGRDHRQMAEDAERAVAMLEAHPADPELLTAARVIHAFTAAALGVHPPEGLLEEALSVRGAEARTLIGVAPGAWYLGVDDHARSREFFSHTIAQLEVHGDEPNLMSSCASLGMSELFAGRYDDAERWVERSRELSLRVGAPVAFESTVLGEIAVCRGDLETARARLAELPPDPADGSWSQLWRRLLGGRIAHVEGRHEDACAELAGVVETMTAQRVQDYPHVRFEPDWVESAAALGDLTQAREALAFLERRHEAIPRPWTALGIARSRVLVAVADGGDTFAALADLDSVQADCPEGAVPFDRARCLLTAGMAHRRARRRALARRWLTAAAEEFDRIGAAGFRQRALDELARVGGRAPAPTGLTPTERRVAELAATGATNKEIAERLFLSPKTVEANVTRAFRKLGISRRAELAAALGRD